MRLFEPPVVAPFGGKQDLFLGIIFGITEVFGPEGSFAAPAGFPIVTKGLIWLFKRNRLPTPAINHKYENSFCQTVQVPALRIWRVTMDTHQGCELGRVFYRV